MKKKLLVLGTCVCLMVSMAACGKKDEESEVKVTLGQYKGVEVTMNPVEVTEEEVQNQVDYFNESKGNPVKVTDRTDVKEGDTVNIDYVGKIDGEEFEGGSGKDHDLKIGSGSFIDGFEDGLIGANVGDTLDVEATFPDEYKNNPDLAGKKAVFTVTVNYISTGEMEPLTDEVVAANTEYKTIAEYTESVRDSLKTQKESAANSQKELDVMDKVIENAKFEGITQEMYDEEQTSLTNQFKTQASNYGIEFSQFLLYFYGMSEDDFNTQIKDLAEFNVKQRYVLKEVIKQENIVISDEEYEKSMADYMADTDYTELSEFEEAVGGKDAAVEFLQMDKAVDVIMDSAVVTVAEDTETEESNN